MGALGRRRRSSTRSVRSPLTGTYIAYGIAVVSLAVIGLILAGAMSPGRARRRSGPYIESRPASGDVDIWTRPGKTGVERRRYLRPMTATERELARAGLEKLAAGREVFMSAGAPGDSGEQEKLAEARVHLEAAQDRFGLIEGQPDSGLEAAMEECNRLLIQCNRRTVFDIRR